MFSFMYIIEKSTKSSEKLEPETSFIFLLQFTLNDWSIIKIAN